MRCFDDPNIISYNGRPVDPITDANEINLELILSDIDVLTKRLEKIERYATMTKDKEKLTECSAIHKLLDVLQHEKLATAALPLLTAEELPMIKSFALITLKPVIYVGNVDEESYANPMGNPYFAKLSEFAKENNAECIPVSALIEEELTKVTPEERKEYLESLGTTLSGLDKITNAAYHILGLRTFFTTGVDEVRAWTFKEGMTAPECAGIIHTDFQKFFLKAEVYSYDDLEKYGSEEAVKAAGRYMTVGKDYIVKDGDCLYIRSAAKKK